MKCISCRTKFQTLRPTDTCPNCGKDWALKTGQVVYTSGISYEANRNLLFLDWLDAKMLEHVQGIWGTVGAEDLAENELSLKEGYRVMSVWLIPDELQSDNETKIWIITEWDRSVTTILHPSEY